MAYKITKYKGKHKIKDTKTGKSMEIDMEKFMQGGEGNPEKGKKKKEEKKLTQAQIEEIRATQEAPFDDATIQRLFEVADPVEMETIPEFNLGRYKDVGYFNVNYKNGEFTVSPTKRNPGNYDKHRQYLNYLQEQNPGLNINRKANRDGYLDFKDRLEYGGKITQYNIGGLQEEEDQLNLEMKGLAEIPTIAPSAELINPTLADRAQAEADATKEFVNKPEDINYNIFNPYAGVDLPTAGFTLGQSIENEDALGIAGGALKIVSGLGRNIVSGLGAENRRNQVMKDYFEDQKNNRNPEQYLAHGGKKEEELATGEYMRGVNNENTEETNAEVEAGEYFQSNEGDVAEIVGNKHSKGGEKIQMEAEDRVLSDKLKLGKDAAKMLSEKYDLKLKAADTYSTVLDRFRTKSKFGKLVEEEAEILKKISEQDKVKDDTTRRFNLEILAKKRQEISEKKHPIEEARKSMFDELFEMQEASKSPAEKKEGEFEMGGKLKSLAEEYGISYDRAKELVEQFNKGGKKDDDKKKGAAYKNVPEGQSETQEGLFGSVTPKQFERFKQENSFWFDFEDFDPANADDVKRLQTQYNALTTGNPVKVDGKFGEQTASLFLSPANPPAGPVVEEQSLTGALIDPSIVPPRREVPEVVPVNEPEIQPSQGLNAFLFPDESPLPPSALQGTIKPERRFDRVRATEIEVEPYLQDLRDNQQTQINNLEGLSPNVRAAVLANVAANTQQQEANIRNQIDTQNLASKEKAIYTNADIQRMEENASEADRLAFEQRTYRAQALTDNDINEYYNQLQSINKQRFMDIQNLNLINSSNEDVYFNGQSFRRKAGSSDEELLDRAIRSKGLE